MLAQDLQSLKYVELQKLAKCAGIRANQKVDKLIRALTDYYANSEEVQTIENGAECVADFTGQGKGESQGLSSPTIGNTPKRASQTGNQGKKRRRTFELEEPTLKGDSTPTIENEQGRTTRLQTSRNATPQDESQSQPLKRQRRSTYDKKTPDLMGDKSSVSQHSSPSARAILDSIQGDCSSAERREKILSAIDKKVHLKMVSSPSNPGKSQPSQIPRFMTYLTNKKKESQNSATPVVSSPSNPLKNQPSQIPKFVTYLDKKKESQNTLTPGSKNWNKIHKKEFSKFDSIDVYLERKHQRKENLSNSTKKQLAKKSPAVKSSARIAKPVQKAPDSSKIFKPTVTSTKNINFDFTKMTSDSCKTPKVKAGTVCASTSSKTPRLRNVGTPSRKDIPTSTKVKDVGSTTGATPFKFTGTTGSLNSTFTSSKKGGFDLKASLSRPLSWKPHTGRLQPIDVNAAQKVPILKSGNVAISSKARDVMRRDSASRKRPINAKNVRRAAHLDRRNNQKYVDMMKRRGLLA